jgi:sugar (pentulose or hexulose) kinase
MKEYILALDLGTTNVKTGIYDNDLNEISIYSEKVEYKRSGSLVEFDAEYYWQLCKKAISEVIDRSKADPKKVISISLTGQAESLVLTDKDNEVLGNAISWMDNRSGLECDYLKKVFDSKKSYMTTGQPQIITTWPVTKILWIKNNQKERFDRVSKFLLLKDFIISRLTGKFVSDLSIACFTYYLDVINKRYWKEMIDAAGFDMDQLPELVEPGEVIAGLTPQAAKELNLNQDIVVNTGMLDHFAGMLGAGNVSEGIISESTGTVMAMATILNEPDKDLYPLPFHYGPLKDKYSLLPVCESGGICYEWFRDNFYPEKSFEEIEQEIKKRNSNTGPLIFLPYILGANSPEYDSRIKGMFYGISINNKRPDFALAVLEGIGFLLKRNIDFLNMKGLDIGKVISLGGASRSRMWNQVKADILQKKITIPEYKESTLYGAAILAASKIYDLDISVFTEKNIVSEEVTPNNDLGDYYNRSYKKFDLLYNNLGALDQ